MKIRANYQDWIDRACEELHAHNRHSETVRFINREPNPFINITFMVIKMGQRQFPLRRNKNILEIYVFFCLATWLSASLPTFAEPYRFLYTKFMRKTLKPKPIFHCWSWTFCSLHKCSYIIIYNSIEQTCYYYRWTLDENERRGNVAYHWHTGTFTRIFIQIDMDISCVLIQKAADCFALEEDGAESFICSCKYQWRRWRN